MPTTHRPFFANFFAAFRAHSNYPKPPTASTSASSTAPPSTALAASHPRTIASKATPASAAAAAMQAAASAHFQAARHHHPGAAATAAAQLGRSPRAGPPGGAGPAAGFQRSRSPSRQRQPQPQPQRRGSDSSAEGFKEARGAELWYIGGRTAGGEETFYKLGMVKRYHSNDKLSLDRLSLESR